MKAFLIIVLFFISAFNSTKLTYYRGGRGGSTSQLAYQVATYHNTQNMLQNLGANYSPTSRVYEYSGTNANYNKAQDLAALASQQRINVSNQFYGGKIDSGHQNAINALSNIRKSP
jgi:hypothetical protein